MKHFFKLLTKIEKWIIYPTLNKVIKLMKGQNV